MIDHRIASRRPPHRKGGRARARAAKQEAHSGPVALLRILNLVHRHHPMEVTWEVVVDAVQRCHGELIAALNALPDPYRPKPDPATALAVADKRPEFLVPLWFGIVRIGEAIIQHRDAPEDWREALRSRAQQIDLQMRAERWAVADSGDDGLTPALLILLYDEVARILRELAHLPDGWLRRLRRCASPQCRTPYFLERSIAPHGRYCSRDCKQAARPPRRR